ncbi:MAG: glycosyltransferase family 4 protein [Lentisphaerae bacterium]|nr:glycosyltransferase family 4 protein [Lentisphaerota bacterium]
MKKILYLFTGGRRSRLEQWQQGAEMPLEFLYGVPYFEQQGYHVDLLELQDMRPNTRNPEFRRLSRENTRNSEQYTFSSESHQFLDEIERLNAYDVIIACGENLGAGVAYFKQRGRLKPPVFFFAMGMLARVVDLNNAKPVRPEYRTLFHYAQALLNQFQRHRQAQNLYRQIVVNTEGLICLGQGEYQHARRLFPSQQRKIHFLPFAIDTNFWRPDKNREQASPLYIVFMGKDYQRDFDLVAAIAAALPQYHFKFITRSIRPEDVPPNAELLAGDWKEAVYSDAEIRAILQRCALVILPLKESAKPSGQSVALQAMACGKPVLITRTAGFWEPDVVLDRQHLRFVASDRLTEWCQAIEGLMNNPAECAALGRRARQLVERNNTLKHFGERLETIVTTSV